MIETNPDFDPTLYFVTPEIENPIHWEQILHRTKSLAKLGITAVQLRQKQASTNQLITYAQDLQKILIPKNIPLIINDNIQVAQHVKATGVHLGQADDNPNKARDVLGPDAVIGLSLEDIQQFQFALDHYPSLNYFAASPVFPSNNKHDCAPPWSADDLNLLCRRSPIPIVAIGGITLTNTPKLIASGVNGIASISTFFNNPDIINDFKKLIHHDSIETIRT